MKIKYFGLALSTLFAFGNAKKYDFKVVSLFDKSYTIGVKYGTEIKPLTGDEFQLFTGSIEADNIDKYKYVALEGNNPVIEESFERTYSDESINEVFNRTNKKVEIPKLPEPFKRMFSMGDTEFMPLPNNEIFTVRAICNNGTQYRDLADNPFLDSNEAANGHKRNDNMANCTVTIYSPDKVYRSDASLYIFGYGSRKYKKVSWGMKLDKKFLGRKNLRFRALASEPTLIREKLTGEIFRSAGVPIQEGTYARLIINDDVYGLYAVIDGLNKKWIKSYIHGDVKAKQGVCYRAYSTPPTGPYADLKYLGEDYEVYAGKGTYKVDEYDDKEISTEDLPTQWKPLIDFTRQYDNWVNTYGNDKSDKAVDELKKFLNIENLLRLMAVEALTIGLDGFWFSLSNFAVYQNIQRNNYLFIPFDFDQNIVGSKGRITEEKSINDCITWADLPDEDEHYFVTNLLSHPQIKSRYDTILAKISRETFAADKVKAYVHAVADLIREDITWNTEATYRLNTGYIGFENHFTLEEFEKNLDYGHVDYNPEVNFNDAPYGILEWVELRGNGCRAYTQKFNLNDDKYISDDYEVDPPEPPSSSSSSGSPHSFTTKITFAIALSQLVFFLLF
jgi:hypothetical protein